MIDERISRLRDYFQALDKTEKALYLQSLNQAERIYLYQHPDIFLFDKQLIPGGDIIENGEWLYYLLRCGRSFGKTFAGSAWVANKIRQGAKVIGLCGPTYDDVAKVMVPAIIKWFLLSELIDPPYNAGNHTIRFKNGARIHCYTSDKEIRGPNLEYLWNDEVQGWADGDPEKIKTRYEDIVRAVRVGKHPQVLNTSTPKTHPFFIDFDKKVKAGNSNYMMVQGSMLDNPTLPQAYIDEQVKNYGGSNRGRQEIYGDLITDNPGAYWTHDLIDNCRSQVPAAAIKQTLPAANAVLMGLVPAPDPANLIHLVRILIGFDPAVSKGGDECGIVVIALYSNNKAYVLADHSGQYDPNEWSQLINKLYKDYNASALVVETNNGGTTFDYIMRSVNPHMKTIPIHNSKGKTTRAEHISALYSQGKVFHTSTFKQLEDQMCSFNINYSKSPDRIDALGLALTELFWPSKQASYNSIKNLPER